jgi:hypothetical protein
VKLECKNENGKGGWWSHNGQGKFNHQQSSYEATDAEIAQGKEIEFTYTSNDRNGGKRDYKNCDKYQHKFKIKCRKPYDNCGHNNDACKWLKITGDTYDPKCHGGNDGYIDIHTTGGAAPYAFKWEHGPTTPDVSGLSAGTYTVTVKDKKGCTFTKTFYLRNPYAPEIKAKIVPIELYANPFSVTAGRISVYVHGGKAPYTYSFKNVGVAIPGPAADAYSVSGNVLTSVFDRPFEVTVTDAKGCVTKKVFEMPVNRHSAPPARLDLSASTPAYSPPSKALTVYPNVMHNEATIAFSLDQASDYTLDLYDQAGRLVKQISVGKAKAGVVNSFRLDGSQLKTGTYYGKLITPKYQQTLRISKQ